MYKRSRTVANGAIYYPICYILNPNPIFVWIFKALNGMYGIGVTPNSIKPNGIANYSGL